MLGSYPIRLPFFFTKERLFRVSLTMLPSNILFPSLYHVLVGIPFHL